MSQLFEKSMSTLELHRVLELLSEGAATEEGRENCLRLRPMTDLEDVERAQKETSAAVNMLIAKGTPPFSGVRPVAASLQRADMGGTLNTRAPCASISRANASCFSSASKSKILRPQLRQKHEPRQPQSMQHTEC